MSHNLYEIAERYRSWGLSVFPVNGMKIPTVRWKSRQSRCPTAKRLASDLQYVNRKYGHATGIAVAHGHVSKGLSCRDFDNADAYHKWADENPKVAHSLPSVATTRGFHVWFRCSFEAWFNFGDGEYRGDTGHYSVLPPSVRTDKPFVYSWINHEPIKLSDFPLVDPVKCGLLSPDWKPTANRQSSWVVDFS